MLENRYGYKVCYTEKGKMKQKVYLITNTLESAIWSVRWYESHSPPDRKTQKPIINAVWSILPIRTYLEYKWRYRGCPF